MTARFEKTEQKNECFEADCSIATNVQYALMSLNAWWKNAHLNQWNLLRL